MNVIAENYIAPCVISALIHGFLYFCCTFNNMPGRHFYTVRHHLRSCVKKKTIGFLSRPFLSVHATLILSPSLFQCKEVFSVYYQLHVLFQLLINNYKRLWYCIQVVMGCGPFHILDGDFSLLCCLLSRVILSVHVGCELVQKQNKKK